METFALLLSDPWRDQDRNHRWPREPCRRASHGWWSIEWSQGQWRGTPNHTPGPRARSRVGVHRSRRRKKITLAPSPRRANRASHFSSRSTLSAHT